MDRNKLKSVKSNKFVKPLKTAPSIVPGTIPAVPLNIQNQNGIGRPSPKLRIAPQTDQGTRNWKTGPTKGPRTKGSRIGKSIIIQEISDLVSLFHNDEKSVIYCHSARSKESKRFKKTFDQFSMGIHRTNPDAANEIICCSADYDIVAYEDHFKNLFSRVPCIIFKDPSGQSKPRLQRWTFVSGFSLAQLSNVASQFFKDKSLLPLHPEPPKPLSDCRYVLIHDQTGPLIPRFVRLPCPLDGDLVDACLAVIRSTPLLSKQVACINVRQVSLSFLAIPSVFDRENGHFYRYENALKFLISLKNAF